ncbi:MAG: bifunctional metallophosphatase/5'-nucleotidase [Candidatus Heimdallarchaeota archaeon]|nr:bifunctional metallophosphatase/5'-nucleotidase [Candidatus Heimdallarchaeota archaeon]
MIKYYSLLLLLLITSCTKQPELEILYSGDLKGWFEPLPAHSEKRSPLEQFSAIIAERRHINPENVLVFSTGDDLLGTYYSDWPLEQGKSSPIIETMCLINYDGIALGNTDITYGFNKILTSAQKHNVPLIITNSQSSGDVIKNKIIETDDISLEIIALTDPDACGHIGLKNNCQDLTLTAPMNTILNFTNNSSVDILIILSHLSNTYEVFQNLVRWKQESPNLKWPLVILIEGNIYKPGKNPHPKQSNNIILLPYAYSSPSVQNGCTFGHYQFFFNDRNHPSSGVSVLKGTTKSFYSIRSTIPRKIKTYTTNKQKELAAQKSAAIPSVELVPLPSTGQIENPTLHSIVDAMRRVTNADIAVINSPAVRSTFDSQKITWGKLYQTLPFPNELIVAELKGSELLDILSINNYAIHHSLIVPSENARYQIALTTNQLECKLQLNGEIIDPDSTYSVAMTDFLLEGGDGIRISGFFRPDFYLHSLERKVNRTGITLREAIVQDLNNGQRYYPNTNVRITRSALSKEWQRNQSLIQLGYTAKRNNQPYKALEYFFNVLEKEPNNILTNRLAVHTLLSLLLKKIIYEDSAEKTWKLEQSISSIIPNLGENETDIIDLMIYILYNKEKNELPSSSRALLEIDETTAFDFLYLAEVLIYRATEAQNDSTRIRDLEWAKYISNNILTVKSARPLFIFYSDWAKFILAAADYYEKICSGSTNPYIESNLSRTENLQMKPPTYLGYAICLLNTYYLKKTITHQKIWEEELLAKKKYILQLNPKDPLKVLLTCNLDKIE